MTDTPNVRQMLREAIELGRAGDRQAALAKATQAVGVDDQQPDAWYLLAYFSADRAQQVDALRQALKLNPTHEKARQLLEKIQPPSDADEDIDPFAEAIKAASQPSAQAQSKGQTAGKQSEFGQAVSQVGAVASDAARQIGRKVAEEFTGEKRRTLVRAWLAALSFDDKNSYEVYRGKTDPLFTAGLMLAVFALAPIAIQLVVLILAVGQLDLGLITGRLVQTLVGGVLLGAQAVLSVYIASYVSAYVGRVQFGSSVSAAQHFGLSGLCYIPAGIALGVLGVLITLAVQVLGRLLGVEGRSLLANATSYTMVIFLGYLVAQFVFSNAAIHRVKIWHAVLIALGSWAVASLVFVWLLPITLPLFTI